MCLSLTAVLGHIKDPQCYETYAFIITKCLGANKTDHILSVETTSNYCLCSWLYTVYRWTLTPVICGTCSMGCYHWHVWSVNIHTRYHCDLHRRSLKLLKSLKSLFTLLFALCCSNHRIWNFKRNKGYCPLSETTSTGIYWFHTQYFL